MSWLEKHGIPNAAVPLMLLPLFGCCLGAYALLYSFALPSLPTEISISPPCCASIILLAIVPVYLIIGALMGREGEI